MVAGAIVWLILVAVFLAIEGVTVALTTVWFAGGALVAGLAAYVGANLVVQLLLFFAVSLGLLLFTRPLALRWMKRGMEKTNVNSMIGKKAIVTEEINNLHGTGKVRIQDIDWMARSAEEEMVIPEGSTVEVLEVRGVTLFVRLLLTY